MARPTVPPADEMEGQIAQTTVTSFRVVEALEGRDPTGVSELAANLDMAKSTVHKHLSTLRQLGYVTRENRKYRLSLGFLGLGTSVRARMDLYQASYEPIETLAEATEEVASVMVPEHGRGVYLRRVTNEAEPPTDLYEGERVPLTATAGGKAILAYLPEDERNRLVDERLPEFTENTITDRDALLEELQTVHDDRVARDRGEFDADRHCIAAPITDTNNVAIAAVTVSGPADRMREKSPTYDFSSIIGSTATSIRNRVIE
ncbi:IclR family transcriptional regulator [Haloarcula amylovorans]|uniref:IclR family transcriptional regulator n=1 Tax=Haloarcula amylovorans TaxID=2562280 RepID=UPI0010765858|nr:IclR family transcriptional regulator [Halomicroarcula amylolytica]